MAGVSVSYRVKEANCGVQFCPAIDISYHQLWFKANLRQRAQEQESHKLHLIQGLQGVGLQPENLADRLL
eukprot:222929-Pelagomonas_calceolata.AAC.1